MVKAQGEALSVIVLTLVMSNKVLVEGYYVKGTFFSTYYYLILKYARHSKFNYIFICMKI
jgi:hypothetical protein